MYINPKQHRRKRQPRCPHPNCPSNQEPLDLDPWEAAQCTLNKPLWMVIPPEGVHLSCPVHPEGHHIYGSPVMWVETPMWKENNLPAPWSKPWCEYEHDQSKDLTYDSTRTTTTTGTGFTGKDSSQFSGTGFTGKDTFKFSM